MFSTEEIVTILKKELPGAQVYVTDLTGTKDHFRVEVAAPWFKGKSLVEQHKMVIQALKTQVDDERIHALSIKTKVA